MPRKRELTFWERIYLPEIVRGVWITSRHFFVNLFLHTAHLFGLFKDRAASVTFQYPEQPRPLAPRLRTRHRLTVRPEPRADARDFSGLAADAAAGAVGSATTRSGAARNIEEGTPRCVACMLCETVCPAKCITIVAGEHPDPNVEKYPIRFDIDLGVCVYCGYCVEACPEDAIRMDTEILDIAAYSRAQMKLDIHELMDPKLRKPVNQCELRFPHQCALHGGQMKGNWQDVYGKTEQGLSPQGTVPG